MRQSCCAVKIGLNERPRTKQNLFFINEVSLDRGSFLLYSGISLVIPRNSLLSYIRGSLHRGSTLILRNQIGSEYCR